MAGTRHIDLGGGAVIGVAELPGGRRQITLTVPHPGIVGLAHSASRPVDYDTVTALVAALEGSV